MEDAFAPEMLGSVANMWHRMVVNYRPNAEPGTRTVASRRPLRQSRRIPGPRYDGGKRDVLHSFSTLSMSYELHKVASPKNIKPLSVRAQAKQIRNRRMGAELAIPDKELDLVALDYQLRPISSVSEMLQKGHCTSRYV